MWVFDINESDDYDENVDSISKATGVEEQWATDHSVNTQTCVYK